MSTVDGATYEGMGKNSLAAVNLIPLTRRMLGALPGLAHTPSVLSEAARLHMRGFMLHTSQPGLRHFIDDDRLGGSRLAFKYYDLATMKRAFPSDSIIDLIYRAASTWDDGTLRSALSPEANPGIYGYGSILYGMFFAQSPLYPDLSFEQNTRLVLASEPLGYYSDDRGLMTARSSWHNPEASFLWFEPRTVMGGHPMAQRGGFSITALGLTWVDYGAYYDTSRDVGSILIVNGLGQHVPTTRYGVAPGRVLQFEHNTVWTGAIADLSLCYEDPARLFLTTINDRRLNATSSYGESW